MRRENEIVLKQSPFIFIRYLVVVEFLFAITPFLAIWLFRADESYETAALAETLSFDWLIAIVMTILQILVLVLTFVAWYFPTYRLSHEAVIYNRGGMCHDTKIVELSSVEEISVSQGWLGKRFNYESLLLASGNGSGPAILRNVPDPNDYVAQINGLFRKETIGLVGGEELLLSASMSLPSLIERGENQNVEFKASQPFPVSRGTNFIHAHVKE